MKLETGNRFGRRVALQQMRTGEVTVGEEIRVRRLRGLHGREATVFIVAVFHGIVRPDGDACRAAEGVGRALDARAVLDFGDEVDAVVNVRRGEEDLPGRRQECLRHLQPPEGVVGEGDEGRGVGVFDGEGLAEGVVRI